MMRSILETLALAFVVIGMSVIGYMNFSRAIFERDFTELMRIMDRDQKSIDESMRTLCGKGPWGYKCRDGFAYIAIQYVRERQALYRAVVGRDLWQRRSVFNASTKKIRILSLRLTAEIADQSARTWGVKEQRARR